MARQDEIDKEGVAKVHEIAVQLGQAVSFSCVAACAKPSVQDEAIEARNKAWTKLADKIIEFAMEEG